MSTAHTSTPRTAHMYVLDAAEIDLAVRAIADRLANGRGLRPAPYVQVEMIGEALIAAADGVLDRQACVTVTRSLYLWIDSGEAPEPAAALADHLFTARMEADKADGTWPS